MKDTQKSLQSVEPGADTVLSLEPLVRVQKVRFNILRRQFRLLLLHLIVTECWAVYCESTDTGAMHTKALCRSGVFGYLPDTLAR